MFSTLGMFVNANFLCANSEYLKVDSQKVYGVPVCGIVE